MGIMGGGGETLLSTIRVYGMGIPPSGTLNTNGSLYLIIGYLLKDEYEDLEFKSYNWMVNS